MVLLHLKIIHMPQWSSLQNNGKTLMTNTNDFRQSFIDFIVLVVIPQIPSLVFFRFFCNARSGLSVALPLFDFASCIEFHWLYCYHHSPDTTLGLLQIFVMQEKADYQ